MNLANSIGQVTMLLKEAIKDGVLMQQQFFNIETKDETLVVQFTVNRLEMSILAKISSQFAELNQVQSYRDIIFDCSEVDFVDSATIGFFVTVFRQQYQKKARTCVVTPARRILQLFKLTKMDKVIKTFTSLDEALVNLKQSVA